jgi:hypothetical protein
MIELLISGCGRSGTGYMASLLNASGVKCGHEDVFTAFGVMENQDQYVADSSWFAVPYVGDLARSTKVIHLVRNPRDVFNSFSRLGMFSDSVWHHFSRGMPVMDFIVKFNVNVARYKRRYDYVRACQTHVRNNTTSFASADEAQRIWQYWRQWNALLTANIAAAGCTSMMVRLEDMQTALPRVEAFVGRALQPEGHVRRNEKTSYSGRLVAGRDVPDDVRALALSYGYAEHELE